MANKNIVKGDIGNALHSVAPDHIVTTSDEVFDETLQMYQNEINFLNGVFDISAYNLTDGQPTKYADLTAALGTNGANVPTQYRVPGMTVRYVQSSDNKYVQFRCMAESFTTDVTQWQGVDDEPTVRSKNLVESGGVAKGVCKSLYVQMGIERDKYLLYGSGSHGKVGDKEDFFVTDFIPVDSVNTIIWNCGINFDNDNTKRVALNLYDVNKEYLTYYTNAEIRLYPNIIDYLSDHPELVNTTKYIRATFYEPNKDFFLAVNNKLVFCYNADNELISEVIKTAEFNHTAIMESMALQDYTLWAENTLYNEGDIRRYKNGIYISKSSHTSEAVFNDSFWIKVSIAKQSQNGYLGSEQDMSTFNDNVLRAVAEFVETKFVGDSITFTIPAKAFISGTYNATNNIYTIPRGVRALYYIKNVIDTSCLSAVITPNLQEGDVWPTIVINGTTVTSSSPSYTLGRSDIAIVVYYSGVSNFKQVEKIRESNLTFSLTITKTASIGTFSDGFIGSLKYPNNENDLLTIQKTTFEYGSINNDSGLPLGTAESRLRSDFITLADYTVQIKVIPPTIQIASFWYNGVFFYDSSKNFISSGSSITEYSEEQTFDVPSNAKYVRLRLMGKTSSIKLTYSKLYKDYPRIFGFQLVPSISLPANNATLRHIRLSQWNVGHFGNGNVSGIDTSVEGWETLFAKTKQNLIDIRADILVVNENYKYWDRQKLHSSYDDLFKQFYPYYNCPDDDVKGAIYSKFPIKSVETLLLPSEHRNYYKFVLNIYGKDIPLIIVHLYPGSVQGRIDDCEGLSSLYSNYDQVIVSGDFNSGVQGESDDRVVSFQINPWITNGFTPANWGYFGKLITHTDNKALDNTFVKGFNLDYVKVINESASSDHYPTLTELTAYI